MKPEFKIKGVDVETYSYIREQMSRINDRLNRGWYRSMFNLDSIKIDNTLLSYYGDQINVRVSMIRKYTGNSIKENAASLILEPSEVYFWRCFGYDKHNTKPIFKRFGPCYAWYQYMVTSKPITNNKGGHMRR